MIILELLLVVVIVSLGIAGFFYFKQKEEKEYIERLITETELQEAEHQVQEVQEPVPDVIEPMPDQYYEDLELLARVIHCENSNEVDGEEASWNTGSVILNRINASEYPNTLEEVIYQKGQYDCLKNLYKEEPTDIEWEVAAELLNSGSILPKEVVYAAEFEQGSSTYEKIGNTYYCK